MIGMGYRDCILYIFAACDRYEINVFLVKERPNYLTYRKSRPAYLSYSIIYANKGPRTRYPIRVLEGITLKSKRTSIVYECSKIEAKRLPMDKLRTTGFPQIYKLELNLIKRKKKKRAIVHRGDNQSKFYH